MKTVYIGCFFLLFTYVGLGACNTWLDKRDYGYLFWPTSWGTHDDIQHIQTGTYGLALDVSAANLVHLGLIQDPLPVEEALLSENSVVTNLPTGNVSYTAVLNGEEYSAMGFFGSDGSTTNPSQMSDMGRFMQRVEIPRVTYDSNELSGSVKLAASTRHLVLTQRISSSIDAQTLALRIKLRGDAFSQYYLTAPLEGTRALSIQNDAGDGWSFIIPEQDGVTSIITRNEELGLTVESTFTNVQGGEVLLLPLIAVPTTSGGEEQLSVYLYPQETVKVEYVHLNRDGTDAGVLTEAAWDLERGVYLVYIGNLADVGISCDYTDLNNHNGYNRHRLVITNNQAEEVSVPLGFDGGNNAACNIVGGSPLLRDMNGEPIGAPLQISKNWHESPNWYHIYTAIKLPTGMQEFEHTFAHSKWGEAYAAAHAQLCLIGWGNNQQWDESSLGAFGESITYDPDWTLGRAHVDDVRPFLVDASGQWGWTGNVGGASFLVYASSEGFESEPDHQFSRIRTHYAYTGPNLASVMYGGKTRDEKIEVKITTQLGRTDDLVRVYYHLDYTFLQEVSYDRLAFFQVAADRYADNGFTRFAYGNETGVSLDQEITQHGTTGYPSEEARGIELSGNSPWVMLYASTPSDDLAEHLANIGFVVRAYEAKLGDLTISRPYINIQRTYNGGKSQVAFELGLPFDRDATIVPAGSTVSATVEYLVPPSDKAAYYGTSDYLTNLDPEVYTNTGMMQTLAQGNKLTVASTIGTITRSQPPELQAASGEIAVEFTLTGGLGYTPIIIHGLTQTNGWQLQQNVAGIWEAVNQAVEGNDYWQAYSDVDSGTFSLIYNVHNRDTNSYRLIGMTGN